MVGYLLIFFLPFSKQSIRELHSSLVGGGNATLIGCQPPLNLKQEEVLGGRPQEERQSGGMVDPCWQKA